LGGSASYAAVAASFFAPVKMVGVVGDDFPQEHRDVFTAHQVDVEGLEIAPGKTFRWTGEYEVNMNNRQTLSVELNVFEKFQPKLPASYRDADYVLLANIAPSLQSLVLDQLTKPKFVIADTMDLWINVAKADLLTLLKRVDMIILNDSEARMLTGIDNVVKAGRAILEYGPKYVTVKKGEHGAILLGKNGEFFSTSAFPLDEVKDPTGAGDCFAGGTIGYLAQQNDISFATLKKAVVQGTLVASFNVEDFSLRRLRSLKIEDLRSRHEHFTKYISV
jgi:sugar/nucleoside kinase (ribokinase family)